MEYQIEIDNFPFKCYFSYIPIAKEGDVQTDSGVHRVSVMYPPGAARAQLIEWLAANGFRVMNVTNSGQYAQRVLKCTPEVRSFIVHQNFARRSQGMAFARRIKMTLSRHFLVFIGTAESRAEALERHVDLFITEDEAKESRYREMKDAGELHQAIINRFDPQHPRTEQLVADHLVVLRLTRDPGFVGKHAGNYGCVLDGQVVLFGDTPNATSNLCRERYPNRNCLIFPIGISPTIPTIQA